MPNSVFGPLGQLNAASVYTTILTGSGAQSATLTVGKTYRLQPQGGDVRLGFGASTSAAATDAASGKGEYVVDTTAVQFTITSDAVACVSRTSVSADTDVIIRECLGV